MKLLTIFVIVSSANMAFWYYLVNPNWTMCLIYSCIAAFVIAYEVSRKFGGRS